MIQSCSKPPTYVNLCTVHLPSLLLRTHLPRVDSKAHRVPDLPQAVHADLVLREALLPEEMVVFNGGFMGLNGSYCHGIWLPSGNFQHSYWTWLLTVSFAFMIWLSKVMFVYLRVIPSSEWKFIWSFGLLSCMIMSSSVFHSFYTRLIGIQFGEMRFCHSAKHHCQTTSYLGYCRRLETLIILVHEKKGMWYSVPKLKFLCLSSIHCSSSNLISHVVSPGSKLSVTQLVLDGIHHSNTLDGSAYLLCFALLTSPFLSYNPCVIQHTET